MHMYFLRKWIIGTIDQFEVKTTIPSLLRYKAVVCQNLH